MQTFDVVVIGAGAMGSAAAYHLVKAGAKVLLLEQFEIDHQKGSSHGYSRIIRYSYDHPTYVKLAKTAYPLWDALEVEAGEKLHVTTGGLDFGLLDDQALVDTINTVRAANIRHELLSPREAENRFPQYRFDDAMQILYQPDSGILFASRCVRAHIRLAESRGATIRDHTPVTRLAIHSDSVDIHTSQEVYSAGRVIITAGAWASEILEVIGLSLPLTIQRCQEMYFAPSNADPSNYGWERMPVFIYHGDEYGLRTYGLPSVNGSGVKAAFHGGDRLHHPSQINYTPDDDTVERIRPFTRRHLPAIGDGAMVSTRICLYTMTPDEHFIIDRHPEYPHIIVGSPCSGHGFKFSGVVGTILRDLALHRHTDHDIALFNVGRLITM